MKCSAVICEFNPIHFGHMIVMEEAKKLAGEGGVIACVMSGNFVQRSTPAVYSKYVRAEAAMRCGADIVFELPYPYSCAGAEDFARGGVAVAAGIAAESLTFGSETGDKSLLERVAAIKSSADFAERFELLDKGARHIGAASVFDSVMREFGVADRFGANDKLGSEYIRFCRLSGIDEYNIVRRNANIPSASELRSLIFESHSDAAAEYIPPAAFDVYKNHGEPCPPNRLDDIMFNHARLYLPRECGNDLLRYAESVARESENSAEFIKNLPTKKYTLSRMRRELLQSILGGDAKAEPRFTFLLAANKRGRDYLADIRKSVKIKIITKPADSEGIDGIAYEQYRRAAAADELYTLLTGKRAAYFVKQHPVII